jgi:hypothetical protein
MVSRTTAISFAGENPQAEHPASGHERQKVAALDLGAYEFCGW